MYTPLSPPQNEAPPKTCYSTHIYMRVQTFMHTSSNTHTCTRTYTVIHTLTYTKIHTYPLTSNRMQPHQIFVKVLIYMRIQTCINNSNINTLKQVPTYTEIYIFI